MGRLTPDEFRAKYAALPVNLREAYGSIKTGEILEEIGKKHGLHIDDLGSLIDETGYVMLGTTPPQEYIKKLADALEIPRKKAKEIAIEVNEQVFKPIRDALKRVHKVGEYKDSPQGARVPPSVAPAQPLGGEPPPQRQQLSADTVAPLETMARDVQKAQGTTVTAPPSVVPVVEPNAPSSLGNLSEDRLTKPFSLPHQEKEYTLGEDGEVALEKKYVLDPYREPVK